MIEIRRILCPIDRSDYSRRALDQAVAIARWYKSTVTALYVFSPAPVQAVGLGPTSFVPMVLTEADRDQLLADTKAFVDAEGAPGVAIETVLREGNAAAEILDYARGMTADLLVIGTHGRSGFERLLIGSVAEKILRKASCPVMTVPPLQPDAVPAGPVVYQRILCPVDFSESSLCALQYAISMAQEAGGLLTVVHVVEHEFESAADMASVAYHAVMVEDLLKEREDALRRRLAATVADASRLCRTETVITHGKAWRQLLRIAAEQSADLIVMGVRGRGTADLLFFGSTTQHVVRAATCPVLTLRA